MSVFVFVVKEAFDLPRLPQDYKDELKVSELVEFFNKCLTKFFVFAAKRNDSSQDDNIIPNFLFGERKKVFIKLPFWASFKESLVQISQK